MSILNGGIAAVFGAAFGGLYLPATISGGEPVYDPGTGAITGYGSGDVACRAQIDEVSWSMRDGYVDGDVRVIILTSGLGGFRLTSDHKITVEMDAYAMAEGGWQTWALSGIVLDAAGSHWVARGRKA